MTTLKKPNLKKLAINGAFWTIAGYGASQILRFGGNIFLTRLLQPEFFGLMAVVNTLLMGLELFSDLGINQSIIQNKRGEEDRFVNTAWTLQIIRGFMIWLICLTISYPAAFFYKEPRLLWLLPIMGLVTIILGFSYPSQSLLNRRMELNKVIIFDFIIQVVSLVALILLAWWLKDLWAFVISGIISGLMRAIGTHFLIPGKKGKFAWDKDALNEIVSFGRWMFVATALMFLAEQSDRLILGKLLSFGVVGVYTIAATLANVPREVIKGLSFRVIFPIISNQVDLPRRELRIKIIRQRWKILLGAIALLAFLVSTGDLIIATLYDQRYTEARWMMPILSCGIWFSILFYTTSPALLALGKPFYAAQSNLLRFLMISLGMPLAFTLKGTLGVIIIVALSDLPLYIANLYGMWREGLFCVIQDVRATALFMGVLILFLAIRNLLGFGNPFILMS
ncbi:MAG: oligosaccharide flippase family protein [Calothrix sp. CSU_2_0]|nr:oligosaccharide flippase family protein [Calothrix sp. CSU_2_0]